MGVHTSKCIAYLATSFSFLEAGEGAEPLQKELMHPTFSVLKAGGTDLILSTVFFWGEDHYFSG